VLLAAANPVGCFQGQGRGKREEREKDKEERRKGDEKEGITSIIGGLENILWWISGGFNFLDLDLKSDGEKMEREKVGVKRKMKLFYSFF